MVRHAPSPAYKKYCTKGLDTPRGFCYTFPMANFEDNLALSGRLDNEVLPSMGSDHCSDGMVRGKALEESSCRDQRVVLESRIKELTIRCEQAQAREKVLRAEKTDWKAQARGAQGIQKQTSRKLEETRKVLKEERKTAKKALWMKSEIARLKDLLEQASIDPSLLLASRTLRLKYGQMKKDLKKAGVLNHGLKKDLKKEKALNHGLKQDLVNLREEISTLERMLFGQSSEKHRPNTEQCGGSKGDEPGEDTEPDKPTGGKRRGQRPNSQGHGRTDHSCLEKRVEKRDPPESRRQCLSCGKAYKRNGSVKSKLMEMTFEVWQRVVRRSRWVPSCDCPESSEVIAPPVDRLFDKTRYGISVWSWFLVEVYGYYRPVNRVSAWLKEQGAPISPSTLSGSIGRMTPLFVPLYDALRQRLTDSRICQGDETSWRVQSLPGSGKAWLWVGLNRDCVVFRIDPTRSAKAALKLFGELKPGTIVVCDRYAAYSALVKLLGGGILLAICWVHARRDIVRCVDAHKTLQFWGDAWLNRYGTLFHLNKKRLKHYQPGRGLCEQSKAFHKVHKELTRKVNAFFDLAEKELKKYSEKESDKDSGKDPRIRPLKALIKYREGLCVFLEHPEVPMDNNGSEQILRGPSIGRKLSFGSNSQDGADFTAMMYSLFITLRRHHLDIRKWLTEWLEACAVNGRTPPEDLDPWLPWTMTAERRAHFALDSPPLEPP